MHVFLTHVELRSILVHVDSGLLNSLREASIVWSWDILRGRCSHAEHQGPVSHRPAMPSERLGVMAACLRRLHQQTPRQHNASSSAIVARSEIQIEPTWAQRAVRSPFASGLCVSPA